MKFKVGDTVRCIYNDKGTGEYVGHSGKIHYIYSDGRKYCYETDFTSSYIAFSEEELELIPSTTYTGSSTNNKNNNKNMSLKSIYKNITRKEPEKSFFKAGIIDQNNDLTSEGQSILLEYLLEKNKDDFNKEVVQPILEEQKDSNK